MWCLGRLTKQGNSWLRWSLVQLSVHAINGVPQFRSLHYRVAKKHRRNVGCVEVVRAMLEPMYLMLTKEDVFRPNAKGTGQPRGHGGLSVRGEPDPECLITRPVSDFIVGLRARIR